MENTTTPPTRPPEADETAALPEPATQVLPEEQTQALPEAPAPAWRSAGHDAQQPAPAPQALPEPPPAPPAGPYDPTTAYGFPPPPPPAAWPPGPYGPPPGPAPRPGPTGPVWGAERPAAPRLTRSQDDRVLGGVLGGLARYWNTDPLLLRILTVVLTIATGGALLLGYLIAWLAIPLESAPPGPQSGAGFAAGGAPGYGGPGYPAGGSGYPAPPGTTSPPAGPRPPRSYLGWLVLSAAVMLVGALALIGVLTDPSAGFVALTCSAVLVLLGAGMIAGAWFGRARWLAVVAVPLVFVTMGAVATHEWVNSPGAVPWVGSPSDGITMGSRVWTVTPDDLTGQPLDYRVTVGEAVLDLTALTGSGSHDPVAISAGVGLGSLVVVIPKDMRLELTASVRAGDVSLPGALPGQSIPERSGTDLNVTTIIDPSTGQPAYVVTLDVAIGAGNLEVRHEAA